MRLSRFLTLFPPFVALLAALFPPPSSLDSAGSLRILARAIRFSAQTELAFVSADVLTGSIVPYSPPDESSRKVKPGEPIYATELIGDEARALYEKLVANPSLGAFAGIEQRSLSSGKVLTFFNREPLMPHRIYTVAVNLSMLNSKDYPASLLRSKPRKLADTLRDAVRKYLIQYPGGDTDPTPPPKGVTASSSSIGDAEAPPT
jgi:hypothetical protein